MAHVRVVRHEAEQGLLPPVCVVCGVATSATIAREFGWRSKWRIICGVLLIPVGTIAAGATDILLYSYFQASPVFSILLGACLYSLAAYMMISGRWSMYLRLPLCPDHVRSWATREKMKAGPFLLFLLMIPSLGVVGGRNALGASTAVMIWVGIGWLAVFLPFPIADLVTYVIGVRSARIDEESIILKNVSDKFAKAVAEAHLDRQRFTPVDQEKIQAAKKATRGTIEPPNQHIQPGPR